ncbi:MAG: class I SAM-dependent methyltransferase [Treponema sp.]|jgi:23S rRNA G2069 N7-methylase RlmK/C1962 C5-methylase RlmI|nr:class I SAM-dependent methyltransferase [Treponema sp.]
MAGKAPALKTAAQAETFFNRLVKRRRHLRKWARRTGAGAYRLYDRDIPEIPLVLDWYGEAETGPPGADSSGAAAGALYKRPYEKDPAEEEQWLAAMKDAAARALNLEPERIFLRERARKTAGRAQYGRIAEKGVLKTVRERGLLYRVNLSDYLDTGLFLDRRLFRARIGEEAAGRRVLNLFCYTAALSVAAAAGGAAGVDSVDLSNTYLNWGRENCALNGLEAAPPGTPAGAAPLTLIRADVLRFVDEAAGRRSRWDLIILDPPAFSNSKKARRDFDLKRDHPALIEKCLRLLAPRGVLYLSANVKGFKLTAEPPRADITAEDITEQLRDEDFRGKRVPAAWRIMKNEGNYSTPVFAGRRS